MSKDIAYNKFGEILTKIQSSREKVYQQEW